MKGKGAAAWDTPVNDFDYTAEITSVSPLTCGYGGQFNKKIPEVKSRGLKMKKFPERRGHILDISRLQ